MCTPSKCPSKSIVIYVNCNSTSQVQTGKTWSEAYISLETALNEASLLYGKVYIHIARGTYIPSKIYTPNGTIGGVSHLNTIRLRTFNIPHRTMLIGGFNGTETHSRQSCPSENETILSGINYYWHVVTCGNDVNPHFQCTNVGLCNLTIADGNSQGPQFESTITTQFKYDHSSGSGLYIVPNCSVKLSGVTVRNNNSGITQDLNVLNTGFSGGIYCVNSDLIMKECLIANNSASNQGGGVEILNVYEGDVPHHAHISKCNFENNSSVIFGGAIVVEGTLKHPLSGCTVVDCSFVGNTSQEGGAVVVDSNDVLFDNCSFTSNTAAVNAGAVATTNIVNAIASSINGTDFFRYKTTLKSCTFNNNVSLGNNQLRKEMFAPTLNGEEVFPLGGGAVSCYVEGILNVVNCVFNGNIAQTGNGGAIINGDARATVVFGQTLNTEAATTTITGSEFTQNSALYGNGGAIASIGKQSVVLNVTSTEFSDNTAPNGVGDDIYESVV